MSLCVVWYVQENVPAACTINVSSHAAVCVHVGVLRNVGLNKLNFLTLWIYICMYINTLWIYICMYINMYVHMLNALCESTQTFSLYLHMDWSEHCDKYILRRPSCILPGVCLTGSVRQPLHE